MTAAPDFEGCRDRLKWIDHALRALDEDFRVWLLEHDPQPTSVEYEPEADVHVFRLSAQPVPQRFGVIASNIVHQIRATLDNLVWQLVIANGKEPTPGRRGNQFPIHSDLPTNPNVTFAERAANALAGVHPDHVTFIEGLQPYKNPEWASNSHAPGGHPLAVLADLSNTDKHQVLRIISTQERAGGHLMDFQASIDGDTFDAVVDSQWFPIEQRYPGAVIGWAQLAPSGHRTDVHMKRGSWDRLVFPDNEPVVASLNAIYAVVFVLTTALARAASEGLYIAPVSLTPARVATIYTGIMNARRDYKIPPPS